MNEYLDVHWLGGQGIILGGASDVFVFEERAGLSSFVHRAKGGSRMAVEFLGELFGIRQSRHLVGLLLIARYIYIPPLTRQLFHPALFPFLLPECLIQKFNMDMKS